MPEEDLKDIDLHQYEIVIDELVSCALEHHNTVPTHSAGAKASLKSDGSRVTELDRAIERAWRDLLHARCPEHSVVGEEFGHYDADSRFCWYLDPVDGTDDLSRGMPLFGYIIALTFDGRPVAAATGHPALGTELRATFGGGTWVSGRRCTAFDSAAPGDPAIAIPAMDDFLRYHDESKVLVDLAKRFPNYRVYRNLFGHTAVVTGALEAGVEFDVAPWDFLATRLLIEEAGGVFLKFRAVTGVDGQEKSGVTFGRPAVVGEICRVMSRHGFQCHSADDLSTVGV